MPYPHGIDAGPFLFGNSGVLLTRHLVKCKVRVHVRSEKGSLYMVAVWGN